MQARNIRGSSIRSLDEEDRLTNAVANGTFLLTQISAYFINSLPFAIKLRTHDRTPPLQDVRWCIVIRLLREALIFMVIRWCKQIFHSQKPKNPFAFLLTKWRPLLVLKVQGVRWCMVIRNLREADIPRVTYEKPFTPCTPYTLFYLFTVY